MQLDLHSDPAQGRTILLAHGSRNLLFDYCRLTRAQQPLDTLTIQFGQGRHVGDRRLEIGAIKQSACNNHIHIMHADLLRGIREGLGRILCGWPGSRSSTTKNGLVSEGRSTVEVALRPVLFRLRQAVLKNYAQDLGLFFCMQLHDSSQRLFVFSDNDRRRHDRDSGESRLPLPFP